MWARGCILEDGFEDENSEPDSPTSPPLLKRTLNHSILTGDILALVLLLATGASGTAARGDDNIIIVSIVPSVIGGGRTLI
jgi:hypothetical protein